MAADNAATNIAREAPFLEAYRRRLMDSVFAATDKAIVPQAGFGEAAGQLGYTFDPATGGVTKTGQAVFEPYLQQGLAGMQQGQQTAAQGIPALQAAQGQFDPSTSNYQQFYDQLKMHKQEILV